MRMCSHFVGRWWSNPTRGVGFLRIHMLTLDHPRILVQRNKGMMTLMRENSQRPGAQVDNFQFTPRLFSGNVGAGGQWHSKSRLQKKNKNMILMTH